MNTIRELDIFDRSRLSLESLFSGEITWEDSFINEKENKSKLWDGTLVINGQEFFFNIISNPTIIKLNKYQGTNYYPNANQVLVFDYANPEISKYCIKKGINYLDASGNAYVNTDKLKIYIEGRQKAKYGIPQKRMFQRTGLKLIFEILRSPDLINKSYRQVSEIAQISIGSVGDIMDEMKQDGFIYESGDQKKLSNIKKLITKWAFSYSELLKPKLHRGFFKTIGSFHFDEIVASGEGSGIYIGGEYAASFYGYLKPSHLLIYTDQRLSILASKYKLAPIDNSQIADSRIEIIKPFWNTDILVSSQDKSTNDGKQLVDNIIIYADLLESENPRNTEIAEKILNHEIQNRFGGNFF